MRNELAIKCASPPPAGAKQQFAAYMAVCILALSKGLIKCTIELELFN